MMEQAEGGRRRRAAPAWRIGVPARGPRGASSTCRSSGEAVSAAAARALAGTPAGQPHQHPRPDRHLVLRLQAAELRHRRLPAASCRPSAMPAASRCTSRISRRSSRAPSSGRATSCRRFERSPPLEPRTTRPPACGWSPGGCSRNSSSPTAWGCTSGEAFASPAYKSFHLVFAACFYYIQIYADFSGYSDISVGLSRMLGLKRAAELQLPVPGAVGGRVLDAMAHHPVVVAARLPVPAAGVRGRAAHSRRTA